MIHHFDHRFATYEPDGSTRYPTVAEKQAASFAALPRYWVSEREVTKRLAGRATAGWLLGWRDICRATDERTSIVSVFPAVGVGNKLPIMMPAAGSCQISTLQACLSSFVLDFASRQKVGSTSMNFFILYQLPVLPPSKFAGNTPWDETTELATWVRRRVLELTYTSAEMRASSADVETDRAPFRWDEVRRRLLRAELDAAYFHLYGVGRDDVDYILDRFPIVRRKDEAAHDEYRTKRLILEIYDAMATAIETGEPYQTVLDPPPSQGARHDEKVLSR